MSYYKLGADIGGSETRGMLGDKAQILTVRQLPFVADLPLTELKLIDDSNYGVPGTERLLPLQYIQLQEEGQAYVLGDDAAARPNKNAKKLPKSRLAVYKVLDLIGQMWERLRLPVEFSLDLAVLLPFSEYYADQGKLLDELRSSSEQFWYRGVKLSVTLETIKVVPEGAGLVLWHLLELQKKRGQTNSETFVVIMAGHRDLSFLLFMNGKPPTGEPTESKKLGYSMLIRTAARGLPVVDPEDDPFVLRAVLSGQEEFELPDRPGEILTLKLAEAREYYWGLVKTFLDEKLASVRTSSFEVIICGGGALALREELGNYFNGRQSFCTVSWAEELQAELRQSLPLSINSETDSVRLSDVYGLYKWLTVVTRQGVKNVNAA